MEGFFFGDVVDYFLRFACCEVQLRYFDLPHHECPLSYFFSSVSIKLTISSAMLTLVTTCRPFQPGWLFTSQILGPRGPSRMSTPETLQPTALEALTARSSNSLLSFVGVGRAPWL